MKHIVDYEVHGHISIEVECDSEKEAVNIADQKVCHMNIDVNDYDVDLYSVECVELRKTTYYR